MSSASPEVPSLQRRASGLWVVAGDAEAPCSVYFVIPAGGSFSGTTLHDTWLVSGWYVLVTTPLRSPYDGFVGWVRTNLDLASGQVWHVVAWLDWPIAPAAPAPATLPMSGSANGLFLSALPGNAHILLGGPAFQLDLGNSATLPVTMTSDGTIVVTQGNSPVVKLAGQTPVALYPNGSWTVTIPLTGPNAGGASVPFAASPSNLLEIDIGWGIRYFEANSAVRTWTFLGESSTNAAFVASVHPLFPLDAPQSFLAVDFETRYPVATATPTGPPLFTTEGVEVPLAATAAAAPQGFALSVDPTGTPYFAPFGTWTPQTAGSPSALRLMPGLFAGESLLLGPGDQISFIPGLPAFASAFNASGSPAQPGSPVSAPLTSEATTAWAALVPSATVAPRWYFCQASSSTFFGNPVSGDYPIAIDARLSELVADTPFPMVPYAGLTAFTPDVPAFEAQVLVAARHAVLGEPPGGPIFVRAGEASPSPDLVGATNVEGMVLGLAANGGVASITLAVTSAGPFGWPDGVPSSLANALTMDQAVMVMGLPAAYLLPALHPLLNIGDFAFSASPQEGALIVLKLNTTITLRDIARRTDLWLLPEVFTGDVAKAAAALQSAFDRAEDGASIPGDPFTLFLEILDDPDWTGILVFGAEVQGQSLPPDLQMLLGGIDGPLRAHHLGVQGNRVGPTGSPSAFSVASSSLFGVIDYQRTESTTTTTLDYEVQTLIVVFANSSVAQFNVSVDLTLGTLFGRPMTLLSPVESPGVPPNSVRASGQYQIVDGVATITFATTEPYVFGLLPPASPDVTAPMRIVEQVTITGASLAPVESTGSPVVVQAQFALQGELALNAMPFPMAPELDLFSYGMHGAGLPFSGMTLAVQFDILADGSIANKTVALDYSRLALAPTPSILRPSSLLWCLPLRLSSFRWSPTGLSASALGAQALNVLDLDVAKGTPEAAGTMASTRPSPLSTVKPTFVFEYDLPLGSLGSLSSVNVGLSASLYVGWGPSPLSPSEDAASVMIKLPQLSGGYGGFTLQGILKLTYGDANLLQVDVASNEMVYAMLFSNIQLSLFGYTFPPGLLVDALVFAGEPQSGTPSNGNNIAWLVAAKQT